MTMLRNFCLTLLLRCNFVSCSCSSSCRTTIRFQQYRRRSSISFNASKEAPPRQNLFKNASKETVTEVSHFAEQQFRPERQHDVVWDKFSKVFGADKALNQHVSVEQWSKVRSHVVTSEPNRLKQAALDRVFDVLFLQNCQSKNLFDLGHSFAGYLKETKRWNAGNMNALVHFYAHFRSNPLSPQCILEALERMEAEKVAELIYLPTSVEGFSCTHRWHECGEILDKLNELGLAKSLHYDVYARAAFDHDKPEIALAQLEHIATKLRRSIQSDTLISGANYSVRNEDFATFENILYNVQLLEQLPSKEVIQVFEQAFLKLGWRARYMQKRENDLSNICTNCGQELDPVHVTREDFERLRQAFLREMFETKIFVRSTPTEFEMFKRFVSRHGPFDVVVDALNVLYLDSRTKHFNLRKQQFSTSEVNNRVRMLVHRLLNDGFKKILFIGRKHLGISGITEMLDALGVAHYCYLDNITHDDVYLMYAALESGPDAFFLTSDFLRDHMSKFAPEIQVIFVRWQCQRQMRLIHVSHERRTVVLAKPYPIWVRAQNHHTSRWHIPWEDGTPRYPFQPTRVWLCAEKMKR